MKTWILTIVPLEFLFLFDKYSFQHGEFVVTIGFDIPLDLLLLLGKNIPSPANTLKIVIQFKHIQVHTSSNSDTIQQQ
jgi:hypothetical protein